STVVPPYPVTFHWAGGAGTDGHRLTRIVLKFQITINKLQINLKSQKHNNFRTNSPRMDTDVHG
ncbi:MAG: hypothetical protein NUV76_05755, partial [Candidatus Kuenenia sp.]|nr:hypothetical protein [Candidatus Kuenenia sp.]